METKMDGHRRLIHYGSWRVAPPSFCLVERSQVDSRPDTFSIALFKSAPIIKT